MSDQDRTRPQRRSLLVIVAGCLAAAALVCFADTALAAGDVSLLEAGLFLSIWSWFRDLHWVLKLIIIIVAVMVTEKSCTVSKMYFF